MTDEPRKIDSFMSNSNFLAKFTKVMDAKKTMIERNIMKATCHCPCGGKDTLKVMLVRHGGRFPARWKCEDCGFVGME